MSKTLKNETTKWYKNPFILGGIILLVWLISGIIIFTLLDTWSNRGTFGDMFGAINSLFSGLALAGIIYTIFLQRSELELQRKEIELNRKELSRTAKAQENSEKELRIQADNLKATARLNALSTLMTYYTDRAIKYMNHPGISNESNTRYEECKNEIEEILKGKS